MDDKNGALERLKATMDEAELVDYVISEDW